MKYSKLSLELKQVPNAPSNAEITSMHYQADGSLLVGSLFASPALVRLKTTNKGDQVTETIDYKLEQSFPEDLLGVNSGLRATLTGDTAFSTLHAGSTGMGLGKLMGKKVPKFESTEEMKEYIAATAGCNGFTLRASIMQIIDGKTRIRHDRMPGTITDVAHMGDSIFVLSGSHFYREPYLKSDKQYTLRKDLEMNLQIHKQDAGEFFLLGSNNNRLMRLGITENKAKQTIKALNDGPFTLSEDCSTDGWLYGICSENTELFRVRINPLSKEEELQFLYKSEGKINSLLSIDQEKKSRIIFSEELEMGVKMKSLQTFQAEDPEAMPEVPKAEDLASFEDLKSVHNLTADTPEKGKVRLWASAKVKSKAMPQVICFTDF